MSKRDKEIKRLRREVEILRAQLKNVDSGKAKVREEIKEERRVPEEPSVPSQPSASYVRADLRRSLIITAFIVATISALTLSQPHWPKFTSLATKIIPF